MSKKNISRETSRTNENQKINEKLILLPKKISRQLSQGGDLIEAVKVEEAFRAADKKPAHNFHNNPISKLLGMYKVTSDILGTVQD